VVLGPRIQQCVIGMFWLRDYHLGGWSRRGLEWVEAGWEYLSAGLLKAFPCGLSSDKWTTSVEAAGFTVKHHIPARRKLPHLGSSFRNHRPSLLQYSFGWNSHKSPPNIKRRRHRLPFPNDRSVKISGWDIMLQKLCWKTQFALDYILAFPGASIFFFN
jgi:hypothetical protein